MVEEIGSLLDLKLNYQQQKNDDDDGDDDDNNNNNKIKITT
jgi:hypothetical protein